ncbi:AAA family ATPase [Mesorhizobium sp. M0955]|uniref:AAA family ATPase n=1 Tax=Mesorhizobium sp. M0955 TaxID=2957033 RepID=UPI00333AAA3B
MASRLKTLVIENFRSLRGKVVIPLDAQVVLIHGSNGMGKTSVLSALELALTGRVAHLASEGDSYQRYLTNLDTDGGSIELTTSAPLREGGSTGGSLSFEPTAFQSRPLLGPDDARFFAERCYLPQATLGRLLEIYDDQKTNTTSPLTLFVKELLGLDPLDALVDGLHPAFNVTRIRNLTPEYRQLETLRTALQDEVDRNEQSIKGNENAAAARRGELNAMLVQLFPDGGVVIDPQTPLEELRLKLETGRSEDGLIADLNRTRSELAGVTLRWRSLPPTGATRNRADKERTETSASSALAAWRQTSGNELEKVLVDVRPEFSELPSLDDDPEKARAEAEQWAAAEAGRCRALLATGAAAAERLRGIQAIIQRASTRIDELNTALTIGARDARSLANALAGVAPHVSGETCPVCDRNFDECDAGPLASHIAAKIASLTSEAGRLQSLATERADETDRLAGAQRDRLSAEQEQRSAEDQANLTVRAALMEGIVQRLRALAPAARQGTALTVEAVAARQSASASRRHDEVSSSILPEIDVLVTVATQRPASAYAGIEEALAEASRVVGERIRSAEMIVSLRVRALSELEFYASDLRSIGDIRAKNEVISLRLVTANEAIASVENSRETAKKVSDAADRARSNIVKTVFNTTLNRVWRDLFVRLAPSEQFVPTFKLPEGERGNVEAVLETLHRSGQVSGSPGSMLSQGNLNTAALTLFLALHLSVPSRMPWLVLDDPVQSMDDVHTAQFAALLRTLSKGMDRQLIVAVHERALFDYLTLELSPAFPGDSLIAVEVTRNFDGDAVATPNAFSFVEDRAIAA